MQWYRVLNDSYTDGLIAIPITDVGPSVATKNADPWRKIPKEFFLTVVYPNVTAEIRTL